MLSTIVGVGFTAVVLVLGYIGRRAINAFDSMREEISELTTDVAIVFDRMGIERNPNELRRVRR